MVGEALWALLVLLVVAALLTESGLPVAAAQQPGGRERSGQLAFFGAKVSQQPLFQTLAELALLRVLLAGLQLDRVE